MQSVGVNGAMGGEREDTCAFLVDGRTRKASDSIGGIESQRGTEVYRVDQKYVAKL